MTTQEFSNEFDVLYNNIMSNQAPGINEYEKSVFLTRAQENIVTNIYNGSNLSYITFESTEESRRYLDALIRTVELTPIDSNEVKSSNNSVFCELPEDLMFIVYEAVKFTDSSVFCGKTDKLVEVVPTTVDSLHHIINDPFKTYGKRRVLRIDCENNKVELLSKHAINKYILKYIKKPSPIILVDLNEYYPELSINGESTKLECELNPILHREILQRAVELAKASYVG